MEQLEAEHDNLRAALRWLLEHDPDACLWMAEALGGFWSMRGYLTEGLQWLTAALGASDPKPSAVRLQAIQTAGEHAWRLGDLEAAHALLEGGLRAAREIGDPHQIARAAWQAGALVQQRGDARASYRYLEESLAYGREAGDDLLVGNVLNSLGEAARIEGEWERARSFYEQSVAVHKRFGHPGGASLTLCNLGAALCELGELDAACACYLEALPFLRDLGNAKAMSLALDGLGAVAAKRREWGRAARLAGAAEALRDEIGEDLEPADRALRDGYLRDVREHLDAAALAEATAEGRATARGRAIEDALSM
jgi:tetratricopeptide (TPR) repeat protein